MEEQRGPVLYDGELWCRRGGTSCKYRKRGDRSPREWCCLFSEARYFDGVPSRSAKAPEWCPRKWEGYFPRRRSAPADPDYGVLVHRWTPPP